jgi:hypothetical protein
MKIQLDTTAKTIKVEEEVNLGELFDMLSKLLPDDLWKEYSVETNTTITWSSPIYIERTVYPQPYWYGQPWITYGSNEMTINSTSDHTNLKLNSSVSNEIDLSADFDSKDFNNKDFMTENTSYEIKEGVFNIEI